MSHDTCHVEPIRKTATAEELSNRAIIFLTIQGLGCRNCAARVRNSLLSTIGVAETEVDHTTAKGWVAYNPDLVSTAEIVQAVANAGNDGRHHYQAEVLD